ncbi:hypothetical protein M446_4068 [Methylobacterium sp. 4-46]|uniref:hypothetical protein n=1 Tax=unclassified Methylobacterium TaxID=2615210 RepID=UPI000152DB4C|nr:MULTISPECIES: hypothetical protein [Methylobacterium]ACA18426.1 hypothetical protein M446_4068 [Methylobacterium sp. 4-46]WFT77719.1 hypothetical protein QA634_20675 [Methylobacterium nodulans]
MTRSLVIDSLASGNLYLMKRMATNYVNLEGFYYQFGDHLRYLVIHVDVPVREIDFESEKFCIVRIRSDPNCSNPLSSGNCSRFLEYEFFKLRSRYRQALHRKLSKAWPSARSGCRFVIYIPDNVCKMTGIRLMNRACLDLISGQDHFYQAQNCSDRIRCVFFPVSLNVNENAGKAGSLVRRCEVDGRYVLAAGNRSGHAEDLFLGLAERHGGPVHAIRLLLGQNSTPEARS